ncbi:EAL domain-containing protein [Arabiibacter massiliensis]|uniref:EAL domain-containing protein n=1 Tax=Arabiibacter massiliensis TaxID=1870985 RepID=UPI0009B9DF02|nr:EAL domain-containing protein [Arabiibacter massiliensis]
MAVTGKHANAANGGLQGPARLDSLTGLLSKEAFFEEASSWLPCACDPCVVCFDIDHFKLLNDLYGLERGDELLRFFAGALKERFSPDGCLPLARLAADTFALCTEALDPRSVESALIDIASACPLGVDAIFRAGIYLVEDSRQAVSVMCDRAVIALRTVKGSYFDRVARYDPGMREELLRERAVVCGIEAALREDRIVPFFQPKCNMRTGAVVGAEALVRWLDPQRGIVPPLEFIPLLERNGLIRSLDVRVWEKAAEWIRGLVDRGVRPVPVSVNVSRADIYLMDVPAELEGIAARYGIDPSLLEVEITESAYSERPDRIVEAIDALAERGFTVLMDDFGSGYSSLNMLKDINVDVLKIDLRFLDRDDRRSKDIMESVIHMARWLDLPVIAEGVETRSQVDFLLDAGCAYGQGYHFARPMSAEDFAKRLEHGAGVDYESRPLEEARRPILDFKDLLHENMISDRVLENIIGAVALYTYADGDVRFLRGNLAYRRLFSPFEREQGAASEGGSVLPFLHEDDRAPFLDAARAVVESCPDDGVEVVVRREGEGMLRWCKVRLFLLNGGGEAATLYGTVADVTAHMEDLEALRVSERRFELAMEATSLVVFELDIPTRTARYSEFVRRAFGLTATAVAAPEGFIEQGTVAEESVDEFRGVYEAIYDGAERASAVIRAHMGDGSIAYNRVTLMAVRSGSGAPDKAVGLVENVTRERTMELSLERLRRIAS